MRLFRTIAVFLRHEDRAQDVAEYCLLTALIALIALGIFLHISGGIQGAWNSMNASLASRNTVNSTGGATGGSQPSER